MERDGAINAQYHCACVSCFRDCVAIRIGGAFAFFACICGWTGRRTCKEAKSHTAYLARNSPAKQVALTKERISGAFDK